MAIAVLVNATPAIAAPLFRLDLHHYPTNFAPGSRGDYQVEIANLGDSASSAPLSLRLELPNGLVRAAIVQSGSPTWSCPGAPGDRVTVCTSSDQIPRHSVVRNLILSADVAPDVTGEGFASARLEGGGGAEPATTNELTSLSAVPAPFGVLANSFIADSFAPDGTTPIREAGSHPAQLIIGLDLNAIATPGASPTQIIAAGSIRHFQLALPPGFLGNPTAAGTCTSAQFTIGGCQRSAQVGRVEVGIGPFTAGGLPETFAEPVFNMERPHGALADLAFAVASIPVHIKFSLDPANHYAVLASAADVTEAPSLLDLRMTLWGVPADHSHDSERCGSTGLKSIDTSQECPTDLDAKPFLTFPSDCEAEQTITLRHVDSWQNSGSFLPPIPYQLGHASECDRLRFEPLLSAAPTSHQADTPTGLDLSLTVPQNQNPNALATPPLRDLQLALPPGVRLSPSAADGLATCTPAQISLETNDPPTCPDASRLGEATLTTPLLPKPLRGYLYLATPHENPTDSLFALYLVVADTEERGVLIKIPGWLDLDPSTGQIRASFDDLPELPFSDFSLSFRAGPRAPLLSGPDCGPQEVSASASSWARPADPVTLSDTYSIEEGPGGPPCPAPAARPFAPRLSAGTIAPVAGAATPFVLRLSRSDRDAALSRLSVTLPAGLSAQIAGIPTCPEQVSATISSAAGSAASELLAPSCPSLSRLGTATIAAGVGPDPLYLSGSVYLAGPYRGAPYSLLLIVPAAAGPFDLGTLSSRLAVEIDPTTAQLTLASEPLPSIIAGVPIELRQIGLRIDRPGLIRNPSDCTETAIHATAIAITGALATLNNRFQVGDCDALPFKPRLALQLSTAARNAHPALRAVLSGTPEEASLDAATITLPPGELFDLRHLRALCPRDLAAERCPPNSALGYAQIRSPLLAAPLQGPIYAREPRRRLPELFAALSGGGVHLILHGHTAAAAGRLRLSLGHLPDIPLARAVLTLAGGRRGIVINSQALCGRMRRAAALLSAHSGKRRRLRPRLRLAGRC